MTNKKSTEKRTETHACDLIRIQDAIDAIVNCTNCGDEKTLREYVAMHNLENMWSGGILEALDAVKDLPSAPPYTAEEIQKMQELESAQVEKAYELGRESAQPKQEWIPVSEKLPEKEGLYIVTDDSGGVAWASESFYMPLDDGGAYWDYANVTAWMPLPKPYKGGNK